jgi:predicted MFS family arabinose efflux permease
MTKTLNFSEEFYGVSNTLLSLGMAAASGLYSFYCRRFSMKLLIRGAIACGIVSNLVYFFMFDETSAVIVSLTVGFTYMSANMIQCDLAARVCPIYAAGTVFAIFMALCNIATDLSMWLGGEFYQLVEDRRGNQESFWAVLLVGAGFMLASWFVARHIDLDGDGRGMPENLPASEGQTGSDPIGTSAVS